MPPQNPDHAYDDSRAQQDDEDVRALEKLGIPRGAPRFNTQGASGRNCPVCYRPGTLNGERVDRAKLICSGCATRFVLFLASAHLYENTLVRITPCAPAYPYVTVLERNKWREA